MREFRARALDIFEKKPMPAWGPDLSAVNFDDIYYYARASDRAEREWSEVPDQIRNTFDRLGIPEAERKFLAGVGAQYDSETVYHNIREELSKQGVIFVDMDTAVRDYPDIVRQYLGTIVPSGDNKFSALNSAVWSGGSFVYVPEGVHVDVPIQAYFRINAENMGQFERTLIIAEPGSFVHYIEGCTAPIYTTNSLHAAVVEVIVKKGARVRYSTVQNWSTNVYNLVTKRSVAYEDADHRVGGRQPGEQGDHEVPGDRPAGAGRPRRGALAELRRQGAAPGRRRQGRACGAAHHVGHHVEVREQGRRAGELPWPGEGLPGREGCPVQRPLRRPPPRWGIALGYLSDDGDR